ncbi:MAG TPA: hypothetical protein VMZ53_32035 [Kofleriaceae bacterium]|nr:hypothetical protein [Kofleriaceae bacterium]
MKRIALVVVAACGSSTATPHETETIARTVPSGPSAREVEARREREHRAEVTAAHRKLEDAQQEAMSAACEDPKPASTHERCLPSCYTTEAPDPRAAKKPKGALEIERIVCEADDRAFVVDELDATLAAKPKRGRLKPHKKGSWQADLEAKLRDEQFAKGSIVVVTGAWKSMTHPLTKTKLKCVAVSQFASAAKPLDACGTLGEAACEAMGNGAARAINVVHYRLAEAKALQAAGKQDDCQRASLEAVAVARGLPRWRQYMKLNEAKWDKRERYRTRFDGFLDEEALFSLVQTMGAEAESVHSACGGAPNAPTTAEQEQSFHTCW